MKKINHLFEYEQLVLLHYYKNTNFTNLDELHVPNKTKHIRMANKEEILKQVNVIVKWNSIRKPYEMAKISMIEYLELL